MKRIKILLATFILLITTMIGHTQDTVQVDSISRADTIFVQLSVDPNPMHITLTSEALEDNAVLQKVIAMEQEELNTLNSNLGDINNTIKENPQTVQQVKENVLNQYSIDINKIAQKQRNIFLFSGIMLVIWIIAYLIVFDISDKTYWNIKTKHSAVHLFAGGILLLGILLPLILTLLINADIFKVRMISTLLLG